MWLTVSNPSRLFTVPRKCQQLSKLLGFYIRNNVVILQSLSLVTQAQSPEKPPTLVGGNVLLYHLLIQPLAFLVLPLSSQPDGLFLLLFLSSIFFLDCKGHNNEFALHSLHLANLLVY